MNHATFKASLFMAAGIIDHETGTRDIRRLQRPVPLHADHRDAGAWSPRAAMAGVPLLNGFLSKEMFFAETRARRRRRAVARIARCRCVATLAGMFSVAYSLRFIHGVFFGPPPADLPRTPHEPPRWMRVPDRAAGARLPGGRHRARR